MRLLVRPFRSRQCGLGSPGRRRVALAEAGAPRRPLGLGVTVEAVPSRSKPDRGILRSLMETLNQRGEVVMSMRAMLLYRAAARPRLRRLAGNRHEPILPYPDRCRPGPARPGPPRREIGGRAGRHLAGVPHGPTRRPVRRHRADRRSAPPHGAAHRRPAGAQAHGLRVTVEPAARKPRRRPRCCWRWKWSATTAPASCATSPACWRGAASTSRN